MIDLSELKLEIAELDFVPPPLDAIIELGRRSRKRRAVKRASATVLAALVLAGVLVVVNRPGKTGNAAPGAIPYVGTASAAFVTRDGYVYVADQGNNSLVKLNPESKPPFEPVSSIPLPFTPGVVAISADGVMAYVAPLVPEFGGGSNTLFEIDLVSHRIVRKIVDHSQPLGRITIGPDGTTAYAWGADIVPIDLATGQVQAPIAISTGEYTDFEIAPDGKVALATSDGPSPNLQEIDLATGTVIWTVSTKDLRIRDVSGLWSPEDVAFSPDGATGHVVVEQELADATRSGLLNVSVKSGRIGSGIVLGKGGAGNVVISPNGERAFVLVQVDVPHLYSGVFTVVPVDLTTNKLLPTLVVGDTQGLGLLQVSMRASLFAVDTRWKVTGIDERTDQIGATSTIPVPSLLAATLQPIAFGG